MGHLIIQRQTGFLSSASVHSQWKINSLKQNKTESMKTNLLRHKVRKMTLAITKKLVILPGDPSAKEADECLMSRTVACLHVIAVSKSVK